MSAAAGAVQAATVTYTLDDVWLDPVISHPREDPRQMTGTFEWTYDPADFENGVGEFLELDIPWWGSDMTELEFTFDTTSIEITLGGNYHDLGVDVTLHLLEPLSPARASVIDTARSEFEVQVGVSHQGSVISGSLVPDLSLHLGVAGDCPGAITLTASGITPDAPVALVWSANEGAAVVPAGGCAGTDLGLDGPNLLTVVAADGNGDLVLARSAPQAACGVFVQAVDLVACAASGVVALP